MHGDHSLNAFNIIRDEEPPPWKFDYLGILEIVLWYLDSGCSKHMTGHHDKLINFVSNFIRMVVFLKSKDEDPNIIIKILKQAQISPNATDEAVATTCYTENRSLIHTHYNKNPYELLRDHKIELKYLHVFGALYYPTNNFKDLRKLQPKLDIEIFIGYSPSKKAYRIYNKKTRQIMETMNVQFDELTQMSFEQHGKSPTKNDWDLLFQPMFNEYFKSPSVVSNLVFATTLPSPDTARASSSTTIDQEAPSPRQPKLDKGLNRTPVDLTHYRGMNLHEADFTQIYDFLKMNQDEVNELRAERLAKSHDPLALMAHSQNSFNFPTTYKDQSSSNINDPTEAMNVALILFSKAFQLTTPTNNNQKTSSNPCNRQIAQPIMNMSQDRQTQNVEGNGGNQFGQYVRQVAQNQQGYNAWQNGGIQVAQNIVHNAGVQSGLRVLEMGIKPEEFNFIAAAGDLDEIEEVNANCILMAYLQHASTSGTQLDKAPVYDTDDSAEYTNLLEPIPEPQLVPQNDNHVTSVAPSMMQSGGTVETSSSPNEETHAHQKTVYHNLVDQVAQKMALGYPNPSYLKKAQLKQQSLYNGSLLLKEHDPPAVYDSEETLEFAQECLKKMRFLKKEIKPANYAKINHLSVVFVPQTTKSKEELFLSNVSNMVTVSKTISIPNEDLSDDTTPSVARKFLNEVKSSLMTLQRVVKQKMTLKVHSWSSSARKEEKEYAVLWNNRYTKCEECKYEKISYDKAYNDMQQKDERLQAQLRDLKGKSSDTPSASNTLDPLNQKLESKIVELEFQVVNYEHEFSHLKTTYKNLFCNTIKSEYAAEY
nr:retrovirus-related Pol polyprotein from transposon TNT 1-94 [Tanacetum cinerariifolium]